MLLAVVLSAAIASPGAVGAGPGPGYFASDNVEFVTHVPFNNDSAGGALVGDHFYVTSSRGLLIYDVSMPEAPVQKGFLPLLQEPYFAEEDPDTNGRILLVGALGTLNVIDVEDKTNPRIIGTLPGGDAHTTTCVLNCRWAYNSDGKIIDVRRPTQPKLAGEWGKGMPAQRGHDVTEIAPGLIVTSTSPIMFLDARENPAKPKLLAVGDVEAGRYIHGNLWPRKGKDKFLLVGGESVGPSSCDQEGNGSFMTFDATRWRKTRSFKMIDEFMISPGVPTDGKMPTALFCAHWFDTHPSYRNGGLVAMAWYEHGTHFMDVSPKGKIKDVGYFLPVGGSTSAEYWLNDEIVYAVDYNRGIDVIRFTGKL